MNKESNLRIQPEDKIVYLKTSPNSVKIIQIHFTIMVFCMRISAFIVP